MTTMQSRNKKYDVCKLLDDQRRSISNLLKQTDFKIAETESRRRFPRSNEVRDQAK